MVAHWWFASRSERVCCEEHSRDIWFAADREAAIEKDDHTGYVSQMSQGLCTILMICAPRRLVGDITARIFVIISFRVSRRAQLYSSELATKWKS